MTHEHHVYGPPGTGKTTYICDQVERAVSKFGMNGVMVSSFTRAAAHEIASRSIKLNKENVGTLHSICWRALDRPEIAETKVEEFNQTSHWQVSPHKADLDDKEEQSPGGGRGDQLLAAYSLLRNRCEDIEGVASIELKAFARAWEDWKEQSGYLDFCDLIEQAKELNQPPGGASVAFIDEAQDCSALEFSLVRRWADQMDHAVFVGDDDQSIYNWTGADVRNMIDAKAESTIVLKRSHRLPRAVHRVASALIQKCRVRQPKEFTCRDEEGVAAQVSIRPDESALVELIETELAADRKVMLLASCGYMLNAPLGSLRAAGMVWHNPYRVANGAWNPIRIGPKSTAHKLWCWLQGQMIDGEPRWTGAQIERWMTCCNDRGWLRAERKKELIQLCEDVPGKPVALTGFVTDEAKAELANWGAWTEAQRCYWFSGIAAPKVQRPLELATKIARARGTEQLMRVPRLIVGTIHSVKGAEADTVILIPDISARALEMACVGSTVAAGQIHATEALDPLLRVAYVGMTRARERLYVTQPSNPTYRFPYLHKMLPMVGGS